ncbi:MAG: hypothetical protein KatS3mg077_2618 [Candidatus Binatia bacterium]|nr:MAG: hypothetical protein KatS3mg077_2618 [Candidatus Binatia bacterium]
MRTKPLVLLALHVVTLGVGGGVAAWSREDVTGAQVKLLRGWLARPLRERPVVGPGAVGPTMVAARIEFAACMYSGPLVPYCGFLGFDTSARIRDTSPFSFQHSQEGRTLKVFYEHLATDYVELLGRYQTELFWRYLSASARALVIRDPVWVEHVFELVARIAPERWGSVYEAVTAQVQRLSEGREKEELGSLLTGIGAVKERWSRALRESKSGGAPRRLREGSLEELGARVSEKLSVLLERLEPGAWDGFVRILQVEVARRAGTLAAFEAYRAYSSVCVGENAGAGGVTPEECREWWQLVAQDPDNELVWLLIKTRLWRDYDSYFAEFLTPAPEMSAEDMERLERGRQWYIRGLRDEIGLARRLSPRRFEELRREVLAARPGHLSSVVVELFREPAEVGAGAPTPAEPSPAMGGTGAEATVAPSVPPSTPTPAAAGSSADAAIR